MSRSDSSGSTDSYTSVLSDDSYLATFQPGIDDQFRETLEDIRLIENNRTILKERKIQSHEAKKRDPNDTLRRTDWTDEMEAEYRSYKDKVDALGVAKTVQEMSENNAKRSKRENIETQIRNRNQALKDDEAWLDAAIEAANARLSFMTKYGNAFSTPSTKSHITAVESNLNSAKQAKREIQIQQQKIVNIGRLELLRKSAATAATAGER